MNLKDDEGNTMRATLFYDEIEAYAQVLEKNKDYHISNATVKKIEERYERKPNEFQMTFNYKALIEPLDTNVENTMPEYHSISSIPMIVVAEDRFGSVRILCRLLDCEAQVRQVRMPSSQRVITTIQIIKSKKANTVLQEERHWLHVQVPNFDNKDVRMYLGCSKCSKRCDGERDAVIQCTCNRNGCTSVPRMNDNFDAHDSTGSLSFTAFLEDVETLPNIKAETLFDMSDELKERIHVFETAATVWAHESFYMQVGPAATSLARNRVFKWVMNSTSLQ